jgi:hypothetical protein
VHVPLQIGERPTATRANTLSDAVLDSSDNASRCGQRSLGCICSFALPLHRSFEILLVAFDSRNFGFHFLANLLGPAFAKTQVTPIWTEQRFAVLLLVRVKLFIDCEFTSTSPALQGFKSYLSAHYHVSSNPQDGEQNVAFESRSNAFLESMFTRRDRMNVVVHRATIGAICRGTTRPRLSR